MIQLNENKLSQLCLNINNANDKYLDCIYFGIKDITEWFNNYWISTLSKQTAEELKKYIDYYEFGICDTFKQLNNKIKKQVRIYNENPENEKKIYYRGFSISKPNNNELINLNDTLYDKKIGFLSTKTNIEYPFDKLKLILEETSKILRLALSRSDAISDYEVEKIQKQIIFYEKKSIKSIYEILDIVNRKRNIKK